MLLFKNADSSILLMFYKIILLLLILYYMKWILKQDFITVKNVSSKVKFNHTDLHFQNFTYTYQVSREFLLNTNRSAFLYLKSVSAMGGRLPPQICCQDFHICLQDCQLSTSKILPSSKFWRQKFYHLQTFDY